MEMLVGVIPALLVAKAAIIIFFVAMILGEDGLVFIAILSGKGSPHFWMVLLFGILGILIGDMIYFNLGKTRLFKNFEKRISNSNKLRPLYLIINRFGEKNKLATMVVSKFIYGVRLFVIFYMSVRGMKFRKFFYYDIICTAIWACIMLPAGWLVGRGFNMLFNITSDIRKIVTVALAIFIVYYILERVIGRTLLKKLGKN